MHNAHAHEHAKGRQSVVQAIFTPRAPCARSRSRGSRLISSPSQAIGRFGRIGRWIRCYVPLVKNSNSTIVIFPREYAYFPQTHKTNTNNKKPASLRKADRVAAQSLLLLLVIFALLLSAITFQDAELAQAREDGRSAASLAAASATRDERRSHH